MVTTVYAGLVSAGMYAQAYRTGAEKLNSAQVKHINGTLPGYPKPASPGTRGKKAKSSK
jgi:hypothetical protein